MNKPIVDQWANTISPRILHRAMIEIPVDILSDKNLDQYSAQLAVESSYPGAIVRQIRRLSPTLKFLSNRHFKRVDYRENPS